MLQEKRRPCLFFALIFPLYFTIYFSFYWHLNFYPGHTVYVLQIVLLAVQLVDSND